MKNWIAAGALLTANAFALTGGPNMPEYTQFEQVTANTLVDPNSGNFTYSIPLLEVPGPGGSYPLALSYHAGIRYNQEASWAGLGWSVNTGAINRVLRGVPDDYFNSVVGTRNVLNESGRTYNVNIGLGNYGLAMSWDANTGECLGATPSLSVGLPFLQAFNGFMGVGLNMTLTPGGVSVGLGAGLPVGTISLGLYDSGNNPSGSGLGFSSSLGGVASSTSVGTGVGTSAGSGTTVVENRGAWIPLGKVTLYLGVTDWRYSLDEAIVDYMNGYLFQDGKGPGFYNRVTTAVPYLSGTSTLPRQRFERDRLGSSLNMSSDMFQVSGNGLTGSFQPYVEPGGPVPTVLDGAGENNTGWNMSTPASLKQITFRMDGDKGFNLLHDQGSVSSFQIAPYEYDYPIGLETKRRQYGAYRIMPVFNKVNGLSEYSNVLTGFIIKNPEGMTYEYTQPVYSHLQIDYSFKDPVKSTIDRMQKSNAEKYATAWLLTAVKGVDFLAQGHTDLPPKAGDFGHWIRFNYSTPTLANWSAPYSGNIPPDARSANGYYNRAYGIRDLVYLKNIETQSHRADFTTIDRQDVPKSTNVPAANGGQLTYDDGAIANGYFGAVANDGRAHPFLNNGGAGGFPINFLAPVPGSGVQQDASFTFKFPGDWGKHIIKYRQDNCNNAQCPGEQFLGFHYKFKFQHSVNPCIPGPMECLPYLPQSLIPVYVGTTNFTRDGNTIQMHMNCPTVTVNARGETEIKCNFKVTNNSPYTKDWQIYSAFINWPKLEEAGLLAYSKPKALTSIKLVEKAGSQVTKEVKFFYDYSLANNVPGPQSNISALAADPANQGAYLTDAGDAANHGKLTLRKVSVYGTGGSAAGTAAKLPDYTFQYQTGAGNPSYPVPFNPYLNDYWGMHSPTSGMGTHAVNQAAGPTVGVAWNLTKINLPTGGSISMDYQRDEFYYAGLAKDPITGKDIAFPNLFDMELPIKTLSTVSKAVDLTQYYKLTTDPKQTSWGQQYLYKNNASGYQLPILKVGADGKDDFAITAATGVTPLDLPDGELVLVVFEMQRKSSNSGEVVDFVTKFVGVQNIAIVDRTEAAGAAKRVRLYPLVQKDAANKWFYYQNFETYGSDINSKQRFNYYLIPIKNKAGARKFYGGDLAVKTLTLDDGFGGKLVKEYEYQANGRKNASATIVEGEVTSSGATYSLAELNNTDSYLKYVSGLDKFKALHFAPWPYWCTDDKGVNNVNNSSCEVISPGYDVSDNILTRFLNNAFKPDGRAGGYHFPDMGITYSRTKEYALDGANKKAGFTEYQFYNLSHSYLNDNGIPYSPATPTKRYEFGDWVVGSGVVTANVSAMSGKLLRKYEYNTSNKIVASDLSKYQLSAEVYRESTAPAAATHLGAVWQRTGAITVMIPGASLVERTEMVDQVPVTVKYTAFDAKTGEALVTKRANSDGTGTNEYKVPLHWSNADAMAKNQLSLPSEVRTSYFIQEDATFDRLNQHAVLNATYNQWQKIPIQKDVRTQATAGFHFKANQYRWYQKQWDGYPGVTYTPWTGASDPAWRPASDRVTLLNRYSLPLESVNDNTGMRTAQFSGYGTSLVIGSVSNARWNGSSVYTGDYIAGTGASLEDLSGWVSSNASLVSVTAEAKHFGAKGVKLLGGGTLNNPNVKIDGARKKMILEINYKALSGSLRLTIQPMNGPSQVGAPKTLDVNSTAWTGASIEIDMNQSQYSGATGINVGVTAVGTGSGYVEDLRVYPSGALVKTYYYDPATYKLIATVDENKSARTFTYDARGRMLSIKNNAGQTVSQAAYNDFK